MLISHTNTHISSSARQCPYLTLCISSEDIDHQHSHWVKIPQTNPPLHEVLCGKCNCTCVCVFIIFFHNNLIGCYEVGLAKLPEVIFVVDWVFHMTSALNQCQLGYYCSYGFFLLLLLLTFCCFSWRARSHYEFPWTPVYILIKYRCLGQRLVVGLTYDK